MNRKILYGIIAHFNPDKQFGFIDADNNESYFFHINKKEVLEEGLTSHQHVFRTGDEVGFSVRKAHYDINKLEAYNLEYLGNERLLQVIKEVKKGKEQTGFIKLVDNDKLYIKDKNTYIFFPIEVSKWEVNLDATYYDRVNELVPYTLTQTENIYKLKATVLDALYCAEYLQISEALKKNMVLQARIDDLHHKGHYATLLESQIQGRITIPKDAPTALNDYFNSLKKGEFVDVLIKYLEGNKKVAMTLIAP
jgi:cold shock CspA family protein